MCKLCELNYDSYFVGAKNKKHVNIHAICENKNDVVLSICRGDYVHQVSISPTGKSVRVYARKEKQDKQVISNITGGM